MPSTIDQLESEMSEICTKSGSGPILDLISRALSNIGADWHKAFYLPNDKVSLKLQEYKDWIEEYETAQSKTGKTTADKKNLKELQNQGGTLMEQLAFVVFSSLVPCPDIRSYRSYNSQHDLVLDNSMPGWGLLLTKLRIRNAERQSTIVVEVKNLKGKIDDQTMQRLCAIVDTKFKEQCGLAIFFSRTKGTGFPDKRKVNGLYEARASQILFHAKTGKYIVFVEDEHILKLDQPGYLIRVLEEKIKEVEAASGIDLKFDENYKLVDDLPSHLTSL